MWAPVSLRGKPPSRPQTQHGWEKALEFLDMRMMMSERETNSKKETGRKTR